MLTYRIIKTEQEMLAIALENKIWGRRSKAFKGWTKGEFLLFVVEGLVEALGMVDGQPTMSDVFLWKDYLYPHRIPIKVILTFLPEKRFSIQGEIETILKAEWGDAFFRNVLNQRSITGENAEKIDRIVKNAI